MRPRQCKGSCAERPAARDEMQKSRYEWRPGGILPKCRIRLRDLAALS
jgi:hypothetical protein